MLPCRPISGACRVPAGRPACLLLALLLLPIPACGAPPAREGTWPIDVGGVPARVRLARTSGERQRGLKGVAHLAEDGGMLLVYRRPRRLSVWMQGCLVPLDVAFLDAAGRVVHVETLAPPRADEPPARIQSPVPCVMTLEMRAGFFARHGLGVGTRVKVPASVRREEADP